MHTEVGLQEVAFHHFSPIASGIRHGRTGVENGAPTVQIAAMAMDYAVC